MGGGSSKSVATKEEADAAIHVEPLYYIKDAVVTSDDIARARASWKHITDDTSPAYLAAKEGAEPLQASSCLAWFYESFYQRLFDVHPSSRTQFKNNIVVQGKALVKMIGAALSLLEDPTNLNNALVELAKTHTKKGVMSFQYGIVGEVLIWTLALCLGPAFDEDTKLAWLKIYSYMLKVILPVATTEEKSAITATSTSASAAGGK